MNKQLQVKKEMPLLDYLIAFSGMPKKKLYQAIKQGMVQVDGNYKKNPQTPLKINQIISISQAQDAPFEILYEDNDLIVINKLSGLLSVATDREKEKTCYHRVSQYLKSKDKQAKVFVLHRLDQYTSGVLMFAKNEKIQKQLQNQWNDLMKERGYIALVEGIFSKPEGTLKDYLFEDKSQTVRIGSKNHGKIAITHYKVLEVYKGMSLIEVNLETGRKNQIRVQMAHASHPLVGDSKYNPRGIKAKRLCLHAHRLAFIDPRNQQLRVFEAKCPKFY